MANPRFAETLRALHGRIGRVNSLVQIFASYVMGAFLLVVFFQIMLRYLFNKSIFGLDEVVTGLMIWSMSLGATVVYWKNEHATIEYFMAYFPDRFKKFMAFASSIIVIVTSWILVPYGMDYFRMQNQLRPIGGIPFTKAWYYALPMIVMGAVLTFYAAVKALEVLADCETEEEKDNLGV